jgi:formylglycine-generating enzyme required for sulfatase activity
LGHLPGFLDIQVSRIVGGQTEPAYYAEIFERGIDPIMEDPSKCHDHSKVPDQWPDFEDIMDYTRKVHDRIRGLLAGPISKRLQRVLNMCYEHEAMHIETLLYMFVQDSEIQPNRLLPRPIFESFPTLPKADWIQVPSLIVKMGMNDPESDDQDDAKPETPFGWDNEKPAHEISVPGFLMQHRPVTVQEYFKFLESKGFDPELVPESWTKTDEWFIKTIYGLVELKNGLNWPVYPSNFQAEAYAKSVGCSLPSESQLMAARQHWNIDDGNHSFDHFIPTAVQARSSNITDLVGNGWEWTHTMFQPFMGFELSELYPGYSADFFDEKHLVCLGASWATLPRIAKRRTFRNWYQAKYPYVFAKFRLVKNQ